jgi:hypothetical protein
LTSLGGPTVPVDGLHVRVRDGARGRAQLRDDARPQRRMRQGLRTEKFFRLNFPPRVPDEFQPKNKIHNFLLGL